MKIKINYSISIEKEINITPADYCQLRANTDSRPDIFPKDSYYHKIIIDEKADNELYEFYNKTKEKREN